MVFGIRATVNGLGGVLATGGIGLTGLGFYEIPNNQNAIGVGEWLIGIAVVMWIVGIFIRESRKGGAFHR